MHCQASHCSSHLLQTFWAVSTTSEPCAQAGNATSCAVADPCSDFEIECPALRQCSSSLPVRAESIDGFVARMQHHKSFCREAALEFLLVRAGAVTDEEAQVSDPQSAALCHGLSLAVHLAQTISLVLLH